MAETLLVIQVVLFGLALGLGVYLLVRARSEAALLLPGLTLLSFALFVGSDALANYLDSPDTRFFLSLLSTVLLVLTLVLAIGALVALQRREMLPYWRYALYEAALVITAGVIFLLLSADLGIRIAAVLGVGVGVLLLWFVTREVIRTTA